MAKDTAYRHSARSEHTGQQESRGPGHGNAGQRTELAHR